MRDDVSEYMVGVNAIPVDHALTFPTLSVAIRRNA